MQTDSFQCFGTRRWNATSWIGWKVKQQKSFSKTKEMKMRKSSSIWWCLMFQLPQRYLRFLPDCSTTGIVGMDGTATLFGFPQYFSASGCLFDLIVHSSNQSCDTSKNIPHSPNRTLPSSIANQRIAHTCDSILRFRYR